MMAEIFNINIEEIVEFCLISYLSGIAIFINNKEIKFDGMVKGFRFTVTVEFDPNNFSNFIIRTYAKNELLEEEPHYNHKKHGICKYYWNGKICYGAKFDNGIFIDKIDFDLNGC